MDSTSVACPTLLQYLRGARRYSERARRTEIDAAALTGKTLASGGRARSYDRAALDDAPSDARAALGGDIAHDRTWRTALLGGDLRGERSDPYRDPAKCILGTCLDAGRSQRRPCLRRVSAVHGMGSYRTGSSNRLSPAGSKSDLVTQGDGVPPHSQNRMKFTITQ